MTDEEPTKWVFNTWLKYPFTRPPDVHKDFQDMLNKPLIYGATNVGKSIFKGSVDNNEETR